MSKLLNMIIHLDSNDISLNGRIASRNGKCLPFKMSLQSCGRKNCAESVERMHISENCGKEKEGRNGELLTEQIVKRFDIVFGSETTDDVVDVENLGHIIDEDELHQQIKRIRLLSIVRKRTLNTHKKSFRR